MRFPQIALLILLGCLLNIHAAHAEKGRRTPAHPKFRSNDAADAAIVAADAGTDGGDKATGAGGAAAAAASAGGASGKKEASSGRLFLKKFLLFKNLFNSNQQPVIPIIITSGGTSPTTSSITSTGTIPSATATVTTSPTTTSPTTTSPTTTSPTSPTTTSPTSPTTTRLAGRQEYMAADPAAEAGIDGVGAGAGAGDEADEGPEVIDEQALQAALAAGSQEYEVVTGDELQGTGDAIAAGGSNTDIKGTNGQLQPQQSYIGLRRKGARRSQVMNVRIPTRYRRYFKNGQKVMLNSSSSKALKRRGNGANIRRRNKNKNNANRRRNPNKRNNKNRNNKNKRNKNKNNKNRKNRNNRNKNKTRRNRLTV